MTVTLATEAPRSLRLKTATHATHDALDKRIMAAGIFANREQFAKFLRVQYRFHRDIDVLYAIPALTALLPDLQERRRLHKIANDLSDLGQQLPPPSAPLLGADTPLAAALGWLYVAEGSNLGGTILYKIAGEKLGLDRNLGARHLAAHPDGAARHWREFTRVLDTAEFSEQQEAMAVQAAAQAFASVRGYVEQELYHEGRTQADIQHET